MALLLIAAGALAASAMIVKQQPNAKEMIDKLVPFQGIIGIILLLWGLYWLVFGVLPYFGLFMQIAPLTALGALLACLVAIGLGILLGYGLISKYALSKNADAARHGEAVHLKLAGIQGPIGIAGIVLGLWLIISYFSWRF
jgi:hypothetical protein